MTYLTAIPAYGRDYTSKAKVLTDWLSGRDFKLTGISGSGYVNKADLPVGCKLQIRYANLQKVIVVNVNGETR